ncbi:hypothetical protein ACFL54_03175 [Planctomycetota bacterium]
MEIQCPKCDAIQPFETEGRWACGKCTKPLEVHFFHPKVRSVVSSHAVMREDGKIEANCYLHEKNKAETSCGRCGSFICTICETPSGDKTYCPKCFEILHSRGELTRTKAQYYNYGSQTLSITILFLLTSLAFIFIHIGTGSMNLISLIYGGAIYKKMKADPRPGRRQEIYWWISMVITVPANIFWIAALLSGFSLD